MQKQKNWLLTFQNFQKLLIENDMAWSQNSNRRRSNWTSNKKIFNQNANIDKFDRENIFWLLQGGKVYRSVNWVHRYCTTFDHGVSLDDKVPYYFEQIRRRSFNRETRKDRKLVYTASEYFKTLTPDKKKGRDSGLKK